LPAHATLPVLGAEVLVVLKRKQAGDVVFHAEPNVASAAAITSVRTAMWNVFLAPKRHGAIATVAGLHVDAGSIN